MYSFQEGNPASLVSGEDSFAPKMATDGCILQQRGLSYHVAKSELKEGQVLYKAVL